MKRDDIQILRAFSVISVILYHLTPHYFPGGWLGVDIFFIISGYLMASYFNSNISLNSENIFLFYKKRFVRIVPSLLPLFIFTGLITFFIFDDHHFYNFVKSAISGLLFYSNFYFWRETGYFSDLVDTLPLLHTWSLSVEIQFYALAPFLFFGFIALKNKNFKNLLFLVLMGLFLFSAFMNYSKPDASFYLLPTRLWQFVLGGYFFLFPLNALKFGNIGVSVVYVVLLLFIFTDSSHGFMTFLVAATSSVLAAIILISQRDLPINRLSLSLSFIGSASYSLYLYHQPVFAIIAYYQEYISDLQYYWLLRIFSLAPIFLLAFFNFRFIEGSSLNQRRIFSKNLVLSLTGVLFGFFSLLFLLREQPSDLQLNDLKLESQDFMENYRYYGKTRNLDEHPPDFIIIGDSLAADLVTSMRYHFKNLNILHLPLNDLCLSYLQVSKSCTESRKRIKKYFSQNNNTAPILYTVGLLEGTKFQNLPYFVTPRNMTRLFIYLPPVFRHPLYISRHSTAGILERDLLDEKFVLTYESTINDPINESLKFLDTYEIHFSGLARKSGAEGLHYFDKMHRTKFGFIESRFLIESIKAQIDH